VPLATSLVLLIELLNTRPLLPPSKKNLMVPQKTSSNTSPLSLLAVLKLVAPKILVMRKKKMTLLLTLICLTQLFALLGSPILAVTLTVTSLLMPLLLPSKNYNKIETKFGIVSKIHLST
jgi:hypothetical protein